VVGTTLWPLYPWDRPGTHCTGGWVGPRASLDVCEKFRPHRDSIPRPSSLQSVAIPTELPGPLTPGVLNVNFLYTDAKSLTSEHAVYDQNMLGFLKFINMNLDIYKKGSEK
jgi:hypothetical protein